MKRLKAWFQSVVVAEVRKALDFVIEEYHQLIKARAIAVFDFERAKVRDELKSISNDIRHNAMARLASEMRQTMDEELKAFEARVNHTLTACIKDEPSHWKADEEARKTDIELRTPKR